MVAASWNGSLTITFTLGLIQFLLAPYSFFVSFARAVEMSVPILIPHFLVFSSIDWLYTLAAGNISTFQFLSDVFSWVHLPILQGPAFVVRDWDRPQPFLVPLTGRDWDSNKFGPESGMGPGLK